MTSLWQPQSTIHFKLHSVRYSDPNQFPDPQQPARPLRSLPAWPAQYNASLPRGVSHPVFQSTASLGNTRQQLGSKSSSSASPCGVSSSLSCLNARSSHWFLPSCLLGALKILLTCMFLSSHSLLTRGPGTWEARRGFSCARSGFVSKWLECA